jgi:hypothetical protein
MRGLRNSLLIVVAVMGMAIAPLSSTNDILEKQTIDGKKVRVKLLAEGLYL